MNNLGQNTAVTVTVGQLVDWADGKTLLIDNEAFDPSKIHAVLYKNGVGTALSLAKTGDNAINLSGNNDGMATLTLTAGNTDTAGMLRISFVNKITEGYGSDYILPFVATFDVEAEAEDQTPTLFTASANYELPDLGDFYPRITAISVAGGVVSITVDGTGAILVYGRPATTLGWSLVGTALSAAAPIEIENLVPGNVWEFYVVAQDAGLSSPPSNIARIFVYSSNLAGAVNIEKWILSRLSALGLFKTVDHWGGQIADGGGPAAYLKYAPFAFVTFSHIAPRREGGFELNRRVGFLIFVGAQDDTPGVSRVGSTGKPGSSFLMEAVTAALDDKHPGEGFDCDRLYLTDSQIVVNSEKMSEIYLGFEADWIKPTTDN
jgi:hypothetical protein